MTALHTVNTRYSTSCLQTWCSRISSLHIRLTSRKLCSSACVPFIRGRMTAELILVSSPKLIPWFVSDVTPPDFKATLSILSDVSFFPEEVINSPDVNADYRMEMVGRWKRYVEEGVFSLSVPLDTPLGGDAGSGVGEFWTTPRPYWDMKTEAPATFAQLAASGLVIFKVSSSARMHRVRQVKWD